MYNSHSRAMYSEHLPVRRTTKPLEILMDSSIEPVALAYPSASGGVSIWLALQSQC